MEKELKLPSIFNDGVVLQRDKINIIWGKAKENTEVYIKVNQKLIKTKSDCKGYFELKIPSHEAGGPYDMKVSSLDSEINISIYFGDVWLLAGQSNMQLMFNRLLMRYPDETIRARDPLIHYFKVPEHYQFNKKLNDIFDGKWVEATGENILNISGIGYFFAKYLRSHSNVPVGLIQTAVGGTPIRSWVSEETLRYINELPGDYDTLKNQQILDKFLQENQRYQDEYDKDRNSFDQGIQEQWYKSIIDSTWEKISLIKQLPIKYKTSGVIWLKTIIDIPSNLVGKGGVLHLGTIIDADETFVNGEKIGEIDYQYPPRHYKIKKLPSKLELTIRLKIDQEMGGFRKGKQHYIETDRGSINLDQVNWYIKRGCSMPSRKQNFFPQYLPCGLFNGMIYPLRKLKLKGILWYQGESDTHNSKNYGKVFIHLIQEWRKLFGSYKLPFLFVQLPNCGIEPYNDWAALREEQKKALFLDNTGMAVTIGDGEDNDLHPLNKRIIAKKLFNLSRRIEEWPNGCASGPIADQAFQNNNEIIIKFNTFGRQLKISKGLSLELSKSNRVVQLNKISTQDNILKVQIPEYLEIDNTCYISYDEYDEAHPFLFDEDSNCASPFKLKLNNYYHTSSVLRHVLNKM